MGILLEMGTDQQRANPDTYPVLCYHVYPVCPGLVCNSPGHGPYMVCDDIRTLHPRVVFPNLSIIYPYILCHNQFSTSPVVVRSNL